MDLLHELWRTDRRRALAALLLAGLAGSGGALAAALTGPVLVDRSRPAFLLLALASLVTVVGEVGLRLVLADLSSAWAHGLRTRLTSVAFSQEPPRLEATPVGELLDRIDDDTHQVGTAVRETGAHFAVGSVSALAAVVVASVVWLPAGLAMVAVLVPFAALVRPRARAVSDARVQEEEAWSDLAAVMEEAVHGQDDVRTSLGQAYVLRSYAARSAEVLVRGRRVWDLSARLTALCVLLVRSLLALLAVGGVLLVLDGELDPARLTSVWLLATTFGLSVEFLARDLPQVQQALGSWTRLKLLLSVPQEDPSGGDVVPGEVRFEHLSFSYGSVPALRDVSLTLRPGRSYALVGRTGSGKSTLVKVLTRSVPVPPGTVHLGGRDLTALSTEQLRRSVATVTQRTVVYAGTLRENVSLFDPALDHLVEGAFAALGLGDWVADLPAGLETPLGEGGVHLSAGEEQLVAFARVLVRSPQVVVLDEATARMDPVTEQRVERATTRLLEGRIGVLVAHRLSTVEHCDEVIVLEGGRVVETGPLASSERFAALLSLTGKTAARTAPGVMFRRSVVVEPPPAPPTPPARPLWNVARLVTHEKRHGLLMMLFFGLTTLLGLGGPVLGYLWALLLGLDSPSLALFGVLSLALLLSVPAHYVALRYFPEWWVVQSLRLRTRVLVGQTGPRRRGASSPGEVVALTNDTDRLIFLADNLLDLALSVVLVVLTVLLSASLVPGTLFVLGLALCALVSFLARTTLSRRADQAIEARNRFGSVLASTLNGAVTVKLSGATTAVLSHLVRLDQVRSERSRREVRTKAWATSTPTVLASLLPVAVWGLYLSGSLSPAGALVAAGTLGYLRWFGWVVANFVASLPGAARWVERSVGMTGSTYVSDVVPGVDLRAGTAPLPDPVERCHLDRLELRDVGAVHEDGTLGVRGVDLVVERGELVLVTGLVGSGKSSLLRALAGIVHLEGEVLWNGEVVTSPETFLRPGRVGYVGQLPRVVSGTFAENVSLGHPFEPTPALEAAQMSTDVASAGGLGVLVGHKGTRLSGGQLQRLALARALAPETELLLADDVSSALDVATELEVWSALRTRGVTTVGSTFKRAALELADKVVVLDAGRVAAVGPWVELEARFGHLAG